MERIVANFLRRAGLHVSKSYVERLIQAHPEYPSMLSIADSMDQLGIRYEMARTTKSELYQLRYPYLIHRNTHNGELLEIRKTGDLSEEILGEWSGIVLQVDSRSALLDPENASECQKERNRTIAIVAIGLILFCAQAGLIVTSYSAVKISLILLSSIGFTLGIMLVLKDLGSKGTLIDSFCGAGKTDCDDVLKSRGSSVLGIRLADATFIFFAWSLAVQVTNLLGDFPNGLSLLTVVSVITLPVVGYSLYYQAWRVKTWCRVCILVDAILICQAAILLLVIGLSVTASISTLIFAALSISELVVIVSVFFLIHSLIQENTSLKRTLIEDGRIINSADAFKHLLRRQRRIKVESFQHEITVGSRKAPLTIVVACNLYCNPCREKHEQLMKMVVGVEDHVRVIFRFLSSGADHGRSVTSNQYLIQWWLSNAHGRLDESEKTKEILHEWFDLMDLNRFKHKYPLELNTDFSTAASIESQHVAWFDKTDIQFTPTFFLNGFQMPSTYTLDHLKILLPSLLNEPVNESELELSFAEK